MRRGIGGAIAVALALFVGFVVGSRADDEADAHARLEQELLAADRAFAQATAARGLEGWVSFYTADAARLTLGGEVARGPDQIRKFDAGLFADQDLQLKWAPDRGGLFQDPVGLGFTTGHFQLVRTGDGTQPGEVVRRGTYITIWRQVQGEWKVMLDTGAADPP